MARENPITKYYKTGKEKKSGKSEKQDPVLQYISEYANGKNSLPLLTEKEKEAAQRRYLSQSQEAAAQMPSLPAPSYGGFSLNSYDSIRKYQAALTGGGSQGQDTYVSQADASKRVGDTILYHSGQVLNGASSSLEGTADFFLSHAEPIQRRAMEKMQKSDPLLYSYTYGTKTPEQASQDIADFVARDLTAENLGIPLEEATRDRYGRGGKAEQIAAQIENGVGGMLPTVVISAVTGGAGAPAAMAKALGIAGIGISAAGGGIQEALNDGASFDQARLYGAASGAVEAGTEYMFDGIGLLGKMGGGFFDGILKTARPATGLRRILGNALEEGAEEAASGLVNPLLKTIYQGKEALNEYRQPEYWADVAKQAAYGGATALAYSGTIGRLQGAAGKRADVTSITEHMTELEEVRSEKWKAGTLDAKANETINKRLASDYELLSKKLRGMSDSARSAAIRDNGLSSVVRQDGTLQEAAQNVVERLKGSADLTDVSGKERATAAETAAEAGDVKYYTPTMTTGEVSEVLRKGNAKAITTELSREESRNYRDMRQAFSSLQSKTGIDMNLVVAETPQGSNGYYDKATGTVVIGRSRLSGDATSAADAWMATLTHEVYHKTGTTSSGQALTEYLNREDSALYWRSLDSFLRSGYLGDYENSRQIYQELRDKVGAEETLSTSEWETFSAIGDEVTSIMVEKAIGNQRFAADLIAQDKGAIGRLIYRLRQSIEALRSSKNPTEVKMRERFRTAEKMFLDAAAESGYTYTDGKLIGGGEDDDGDVRHSFSERETEVAKSTQSEVTAEYQKTVDAILNGSYSKSQNVILGYTPQVYQRLGMPALPFVIGSGHIYSAAKTEAEARQDGNFRKGTNYHGLGEKTVKNLLKYAEKPIMIISSKDVNPNAVPLRSNHSVVAIIDVGTPGKNLLLPIEITAERTVNGQRMDVNVLSSAYGRNVENLVSEAIAQENSGDIGIYYMTKEASALIGARVPFPARLQNVASDTIIHPFSEKVNMQISDQTQSKQFKRWFGDWQNHPESASKVVNDDGTPRVVYHGTNAKFWTFDLSRSGSNFGDVAEGLFFFTNKKSGYQNSASDYARNAVKNGGEERVLGCYLNMKKPLVLHSDGYYTPTAYFDKNAEAVYKQYLNGDYDGIIIENSDKSVDDSVIYMLDNPTQIKSATDNLGTFDSGNPDIRYSLSEKPEGKDADGESEEGVPRRVKTPISEKTRTEIERQARRIRAKYEAQIEEEASKIREKFDAGDGMSLQDIQEEYFDKSLSQRIDEENKRYKQKVSALEESERLTDVAREWRLAALEREHAERLSRIREEQGALDDAIRHTGELRNRMEAEVREVRAPIADADQSRVLTELKPKEKSLTERARETWDNMILNFTDDQAAVIKEGKRLGIQDMDAKVNYTRAARNAAQYAMSKGGKQVDIYGREMGPSLSDVFRGAYNRGKKYQKEFYTYLLWMHHADRIRQGKTVMGDYTADEAIQEANRIVTRHPEMRAMAEKVWKYNDNLLKIREQYGLITHEATEEMRQRYPHYVPTFRAEQGNGTAGASADSRGMSVRSTIETAVGSTRDIMPLLESMAKQTMEVYQAGRLNEMIGTLVDAAKANRDITNITIRSVAEDQAEKKISDTQRTAGDEFAEALRRGEDPVNLLEDAESESYAGMRILDPNAYQNSVSYYRNGKRMIVQVTPEIYHGLKTYLPKAEIGNVLLDLISRGNRTFKELVTSKNPLFVIRNVAKDLQEAAFTTKYGITTFYRNLPRSYWQILKNGKYWQEYQMAGGLSSSIYDYYEGVKASEMRNKPSKDAGAREKLTYWWEKASSSIEYVNMVTEQATRLTEFILAREHGASLQQALLDSAEVTTNFSRGGTFAKALNRTIMPFLNPSIQGWSKLTRGIVKTKGTQAWIRLIVKSVLLGILPAALNDLINRDNEWYDALPVSDKENYYIIALGKGNFLRIPKGRIQAAVGSLWVHGSEMAKGQENLGEAVSESFGTVLDQVSPVGDFTRNFFSPFTDIATNTTWYGSEIEGASLQSLKPSERYDNRTSDIAILIGKLINYSPKKIHYLIDQYTGVLGDLILPPTSRGNIKYPVISPLKDAFVVSAQTHNRYANDFYNKIDQLTQERNSGDLKSYFALRYLNSAASDISEMYGKKNEIEASDLSITDKRKQSDALTTLIGATQKAALENAEKLERISRTLDYSGRVDAIYRSSEYGELDGKQKESVGDRMSDYYYDLARSEMTGEYPGAKQSLMKAMDDDSLFIALAQINRIEGDTDRNGNTVSGSRKKKIMSYIKSLDIPKAKKYMLMGYLGYKNTSGGKDVMEYINGLDLSRAEEYMLYGLSGYNASGGKKEVWNYINNLNMDRENKQKLWKACGF